MNAVLPQSFAHRVAVMDLAPAAAPPALIPPAWKIRDAEYKRLAREKKQLAKEKKIAKNIKNRDCQREIAKRLKDRKALDALERGAATASEAVAVADAPPGGGGGRGGGEGGGEGREGGGE